MAKNKIERIDQEIAKVREKIAEYQEKLKALEVQKTEAENLEIVQMVRALRMTPAQLSRGHTQCAHHLDDLQIFCLGFLYLQRLELFLILCDLLADLSNLLVNAFNFVLCHRLSLLLKNLCYQFIRP